MYLLLCFVCLTFSSVFSRSGSLSGIVSEDADVFMGADGLNNGDNGYEGDINMGGLSRDQWLATFDDPGPGKPGQQGAAIRGNQFRWKGGIVPYTIYSSATDTLKNSIARAVEHYKEKTCIKLVPRTNQADYVHFVRGRGCGLSFVGRQGGRQEVEIGRSCEKEMGVVVHELMHALGFFHEQSRTDRDTFVTIQEWNMDKRFKNNFHKYSQGKIDHLGVEYDLDSVMHYPRDAFTINGGDTIVPTSGSADRIGQRKGLSAKDVRKVNRLYGCSGSKPTIPKGPLATPPPTRPKPKPTGGSCQQEATYLFDTEPSCSSNSFCYQVCSIMVSSGDTLRNYKCDGGVCECDVCSSGGEDLTWPEFPFPLGRGGGQTGDCSVSREHWFTTQPSCTSDQFCRDACKQVTTSGEEIRSASCSSGSCKCNTCGGSIDLGFDQTIFNNFDVGGFNTGVFTTRKR